MAWVGVGMVAVGGILLWSAVHNLSPWAEFQAALRTGALGSVAAPTPTAATPAAAGAAAQKGF